MYILERTFELPIGHRLSKHERRCKFIHGHNFVITVKIQADILNENDMVIDFSAVKRDFGSFLDDFDHACMLNENDTHYDKILEISDRIRTFQCDPTAEALAKFLLDHFDYSFTHGTASDNKQNLRMHSVKVQEATGAAVTYVRD